MILTVDFSRRLAGKARRKAQQKAYAKAQRVINPEYWRAKSRKANRLSTERRRERIRELKDKPCADCGVKYHSCVMDFDHVRGEKEFDLSDAGRVAWAKVLAEADKCEVVCSNCHRMRTFGRMGLAQPLQLDPITCAA